MRAQISLRESVRVRLRTVAHRELCIMYAGNGGSVGGGSEEGFHDGGKLEEVSCEHHLQAPHRPTAATRLLGNGRETLDTGYQRPNNR